jgi:hypothetical protein
MDSSVVLGLAGSAVLAYLIPKFSPYIDSFLLKISTILFKKMPSGIRGYFRKRRLIKINIIRKTRLNQDAVIFQSMKATAYFLLFWGVIAFYTILIIIGPYRELMAFSKTLATACSIPIYIFEVLWLLETNKANVLIKNRGRLRVTRRST